MPQEIKREPPVGSGMNFYPLNATTRGEIQRQRRNIAKVLGGTAMVIGAGIMIGIKPEIGGPQYYPPLQRRAPPAESLAPANPLTAPSRTKGSPPNVLKVVSFNVAHTNVSRQLRRIRKTVNPDVLCAQEVYESDIANYQKALPNYGVVFAPADVNLRFPRIDNPFGDAIFTKEKPGEISSERFVGSYDFGEFFSNLFKRSLTNNILRSYKESREAMSVTIPAVVQAGVTVRPPVTVVNTHLQADNGHGVQEMTEYKAYLSDVMANQRVANIGCGDMNRETATVRAELTGIGGKDNPFIVPNIGVTTVGTRQHIDHIFNQQLVERPHGGFTYLKLVKNSVLPEISDHHPIEADFKFYDWEPGDYGEVTEAVRQSLSGFAADSTTASAQR